MRALFPEACGQEHSHILPESLCSKNSSQQTGYEKLENVASASRINIGMSGAEEQNKPQRSQDAKQYYCEETSHLIISPTFAFTLTRLIIHNGDLAEIAVSPYNLIIGLRETDVNGFFGTVRSGFATSYVSTRRTSSLTK